MQFSGQPGPGRFYKPKGLKQNHLFKGQLKPWLPLTAIVMLFEK